MTDFISTPQNYNRKDISDLNIQNVTGMKISDKEKLKKTAQEFEAVFISQLLNEMDKTIEKSGYLSGGKVENTFKSMMNQYVAKDIASNPKNNCGIASQIYKQLEGQLSAKEPESLNDSNANHSEKHSEFVSKSQELDKTKIIENRG